METVPTEPVPGHVQMLATFKGLPFDSSLKALNMKPAATATVLSKVLCYHI